jgi:site-specific recombinase XerD
VFCKRALPVFWKYGFARTTLPDLERATGVNKSGLSGVTPHVLRHSFASIADDLGFTEVTIAALVGHAKGSVTSKYIHMLSVSLRRIRSVGWKLARV